MTTFTTGGSAVTFTTSGSAVSFAVTAASNGFTTSAVLTPGAHASTHGAGGADPITTLGTVTTTLGTVTTLVANTATINAGTAAGLVHTGQSIFAAGSAAGPSLIFTGDTNTGIYSPGADQVGIATAGTAAVTVDASQRVGIGSTAPAYDIHVVKQGNAVESLDSNGGTPFLLMRRSNGTIASPTAVVANDVLGAVAGRGYNGSALTTSRTTFQFEAEENWSTTANGTRMTFYTTANGTTSPTERMRIDNAGLITGTGTSLGAWTSYTPTLGGFTLGDGTWSAAYMRIGKVCVFRAVLTFGSTTTAASAFPTFTLPVTAAGTTNIAMNAQFFDTSASAYYTATSRQSSTTVVTMGILGASGVHTTCTTTTPFTWGVGDQIILSGTYEIA